MNALVIAAHGRQYLVELSDGRRLHAFPRGKKSDIACGDEVILSTASADQAVIERVAPRRSLLYRSNEIRQKLIAANVDQLVVVVATEPAFSDELVTRALVAADSQDIASLIVLNKCDLAERLPAARAQLSVLAGLGYPILEICAREHARELQPFLADKTSVLVGQSGMGKSTLVNALVPEAGAATREISLALDSGKHTTTHACLYHLSPSGSLIDSPGLQEFGLGHLNREEVERAFPEFRPLIGTCRFRDCRHDREPGCTWQEALQTGAIDPGRFNTYRRILAQNQAGKRHAN